MTYRIELTERFIADLDAHLSYLQREKVSAYTTNRWFAKLYEKVLSLDDIPKRYPVDRVFTEVTGVVTRKMNFGDYLVFYQVDDGARQVNVLAFRHGATRREA